MGKDKEPEPQQPDEDGDGEGEEEEAGDKEETNVFFGGKVTIHIHQAKELVAMDKGKKGEAGTSDPFAKISAAESDNVKDKGKDMGKTQHVMKTVNPVFEDDPIVFTVTPLQRFVRVEMFDYDGPVGSSDSLGVCVVDLMTEFGSGEPVKDWYELKPTGKKPVTGAVEFTLTFVPEQPTPAGTVIVTIHGARDLVAMDKGKKGQEGSSDPFFKIFREDVMLKPKEVEILRTHVVSKSLAPDFGDFRCKFDVSSRHNAITIEGFDYDGPLSSASLGQVTVPIKDFTQSCERKFYALTTAPKSKVEATGEVELTMQFVAWEPFPEGTFQVHVHSGHGLLAMDGGKKGQEGSSDPFARLYMENRRLGHKAKAVGKTETIKKTLEPVWDERFRFDTVQTDKELIIEVFDQDALTETSLGEIALDAEALKAIMDGQPVTAQRFPLTASRDTRIKLANKGKPPPDDKGEVELSISFEPWTPTPEGSLNIVVNEARGLAATDQGRRGQEGTSDPFAKVFLEDRRYEAKSRMVDRTNTIKKNLAPVWNQRMRCDVMPFHKEIIVEVFDEDRASSESLGHVIIPLKPLVGKGSTTEWYPLEAIKKNGIGQGEVSVQLEFIPWEHTPDGHLSLEIKQAKDLLAMDKSRKGPGSSDPLCEVFLQRRGGKLKGLRVGRTPTIVKSLQPVWTEGNRFGMEVLNFHKEVIAELFDEDKVGDNDTMGQVELDLKHIASNPNTIETPQWFDLLPASRSSPAQGQLQVGWKFTPWVHTREGTLHVRVMEARGLRATDRGGTSDPFVIVYCDNRYKKSRAHKVGQTEVVKKTVEPKWDAAFAFEVDKMDKTLLLEVFDYDGPMSKELLGRAALPVRDFQEGMHDEWYPLYDNAGNQQGELRLQLNYEGEEESDEEPEEEVQVDTALAKVTRFELCVMLDNYRGLPPSLASEIKGVADALQQGVDNNDEGALADNIRKARDLMARAGEYDQATSVLKLAHTLKQDDTDMKAVLALGEALQGDNYDEFSVSLKRALKSGIGREATTALLQSTKHAAITSLSVHKHKLSKAATQKITNRLEELEQALAEGGNKAGEKRRRNLARELIIAGLERDALPPAPLVAQYTQAFDACQKDGVVSKDDVWLLLVSVGDPASAQELEAIVGEVGSDGLTKPAFLALMEKRYAQNAEREAGEAFVKFDADGSGSIDLDELGTLINNLGIQMDSDQIKLMMGNADQTGSGELTFQEFVAAI